MLALFDHAQQWRRLGAVRAQSEGAPAEQPEKVGERGRSEIYPVAPGRDAARRLRQHRELLEREVHLALKRAGAPFETRVVRRSRSVRGVHEAPVEVEARIGAPVALAERVGESVVDPARGVDSDQITAPRRVANLGDRLRAPRQAVLHRPRGRLQVGGKEEVGILAVWGLR